VYETLLAVRERVVTTGFAENSDLSALHTIREQSLLLFGPEIPAYIDEWIAHAAALATARDVLRNPEAAGRAEWVQKKFEALSFFGKQFGSPITDRFRKYIGAA
jgi:hypothetical protein